jgi:hypothetical protein
LLPPDFSRPAVIGEQREKRIKKACSRAQAVALFAYNSRAAEIWWQQNQNLDTFLVRQPQLDPQINPEMIVKQPQLRLVV